MASDSYAISYANDVRRTTIEIQHANVTCHGWIDGDSSPTHNHMGLVGGKLHPIIDTFNGLHCCKSLQVRELDLEGTPVNQIMYGCGLRGVQSGVHRLTCLKLVINSTPQCEHNGHGDPLIWLVLACSLTTRNQS